MLLYEMLCGETPFADGNPNRVQRKILEAPLPLDAPVMVALWAPHCRLSATKLRDNTRQINRYARRDKGDHVGARRGVAPPGPRAHGAKNRSMRFWILDTLKKIPRCQAFTPHATTMAWWDPRAPGGGTCIASWQLDI